MKILSRTDSILQLSRRLDWRFLLPEPQLRRVAYCGPEHSTLAIALREFSEEFHTFAPTAPPSEGGFDVAVLAAPTVPQLAIAQQWLAPGGHLYAEAQHAWDWRTERKLPVRSRKALSIEDWLENLARLGFVESKAYWHRPSFERAVQIIPLHDDGARDFVFARRSDDFMSQLKSVTGRSVMKNAWLARLLQCVSLVARKQP
ncbi:hypothetical protein HUU05_07015 [candidate division KSB1 bacterium]|nr:hypothetical protein [candidate division KSB1 bacterium]